MGESPRQSEDTPKKIQKSEAKYAGLKFILFVKSKPGSPQQETWFECVLCDAHHKLAPKQMTIHLRSFSHLKMVMKVECPEYFSSHEKEPNSQELLKDILDIESHEPSQSMIAAYPENVNLKREELLQQIKALSKNNETELNGSNEEDSAVLDEEFSETEDVPNEMSLGTTHSLFDDTNVELKTSPVDVNEDTNDKYLSDSEMKHESPDTNNESQDFSNDDNIKYSSFDNEDSTHHDNDSLNRYSAGDDENNELEDDESEMQLYINAKPVKQEEMPEMSFYHYVQKGFEGKLCIMSILEDVMESVKGILRYGKTHPYHLAIDRSYCFKLGDKNFCANNMSNLEWDFLVENLNKLYFENEVLSYLHKPILPMSKVRQIVQLFHCSLNHPDSQAMFEILAREFFVFPETILGYCEALQEKCPVCNATSDNLMRVHSAKILDAYNEWPHRREMKALGFTPITSMSFCRNPTQIVIVGDERDIGLKSLIVKDVTVRICPGLNLENAFDFISCDPMFGQGVLFAVLCGSFTFVRWEPDPDCQKQGCPEPLLLPCVVRTRESELYNTGMKAAINLHQAVVLNSAKDDVVFGHVLPIALNSNAKFMAHQHLIKYKHKSVHSMLTEPSKDLYVSLNVAILNYNGWTDRFAKELGYYPWNMSAGFFSEVMSNRKKIHKFNLGKLADDGVHFTSITQVLRSEMITEICKSNLREMQSREKNGAMKNFISTINPLVTRPKTTRKFDKVLIFCEPESKVLLNKFASSQVLVSDSETSPASIQQLCTCFNLKDFNTLWIFTSTIRPIAQRFGFEQCSPQRNCSMQLPFIAPRNEFMANSGKGVQDLMNSVKDLILMARSVVGEKCTAIVAPVMPVTVVNADMTNHETLHRLYCTMPQVFISNNAAIKVLLPVYDSLRENSTALAKQLLKDQGLNPYPLMNFKPRVKGSFRTLGVKQLYFPFLPIEWEDMMNDLIFTALNGFPVVVPNIYSDLLDVNPLTFLSIHTKQPNSSRFVRIVFLASESLQDVVMGFQCPLVEMMKVELDASEQQFEEVIGKIKAYSVKTLFIYLGDLSMIMKKGECVSCKLNRCDSPRSCYFLKCKADPAYQGMDSAAFIDEAIRSTFSKLERLANAVCGTSFFIVSPLCPVRGFCLQNGAENLHEVIHNFRAEKRTFELLDGEKSEWMIACSALDKLWFFLMESFVPSIGGPYKSLINYELKKDMSLQMVFQLEERALPSIQFNLWKNTIAVFINLCLKMRKDGKFYDKKTKEVVGSHTPPLPPPTKLSLPPPPPFPPPLSGIMPPFGIGCPLGPPPPMRFPLSVPPPGFGVPPPNANIAFPGPQIYSYPVPSLNTPDITLATAALIQKGPVKYDVRKSIEELKKSLPDIPLVGESRDDFRIMVGKIDASIKDIDINMILSLIGDFIIFERPKIINASYGVARFMTEESAERCVRLLHNYPLRPGPIEVRFLYYRDVKEDEKPKLGISVVQKDENIKNLLADQVKRLNLHIMDESNSISVEGMPTSEGVGPEAAKKKSIFKFKYSMEPIKDGSGKPSDLLEILSEEKRASGSEMAQSQAAKLANYLKKKKLSRSRSRSRSLHRKRSRSRSSSSSRHYRSRSYSRSRSRSWTRSRSHSPRPYHKRGRGFFRGRGPYPYFTPYGRPHHFGGRGRGGGWVDERPPIPRRPKSPPRELPKSSGEYKGFHLISSEEEVFPDETEQKSFVEVKISNVPRLVSIKFLNDLVFACGSPTHCRKESSVYYAQFPTLKRATMVVQHLNNWRIIDKVIKAEVLGDTKDVVKEITMVEDTAIAKEIEGVYDEFKETFIIKMQGEIMKDPDIFTFKIFKCGVVKCREYDCHYYHNPYDRRRDYLEFKYSDRMCSHVKNNAPCPKGEYCNMCHSAIERVYHPKNYKTNVCLDWYESKKCPKKSFCAKAHPMSVDSFFTEAWKDLFIAGLDQSFYFFAGAIKMLYKVPDNEGGVPIMFVTTLPEIANFACEIAKPVARIHRLKIAVITEVFQDPAGAHILIGTPSGLASLVESKGSAPLGGLRVIILDEATTLINNPYHQHHLKFLIHSVFNEVSNKKMICKIATSETCHPSEISKIADLMNTELSLYNPHGVDPNTLPDVVVTAPLSVLSPPSKITKKWEAKPDVSSDASEWESDHEGGKRSSSSPKPTKRRSRGSRKARRYSSSDSSSSSRSSSRSSHSSSRSRSRGRKRKHSGASSDVEKTKEVSSTFSSEILARMKKEENALFKDHEAAYEVYLEVAEMHPSYEDKYDRFLQSYKKKYNNTEESEHMTKMWHKYWKLCIESIKSKEWKRKKKELLEKFRLEARVALSGAPAEIASNDPPPLSSAAVLMAISEISGQAVPDFSVGGALDRLESLSDLIGDVGCAMKTLISGVRLFGLSTKKGMDLLSEEDNILTINVAFEKILNLCQKMNADEKERCKDVIAWGLRLIKYSKEFGKEPESEGDGKSSSKESKQSVRFDLNLFAQQTYNQDPSWIYKTLEESLQYVYGAKPDDEIVKKTYANIGAIHLNMSASTPYLMSSGVGAMGGFSHNPGIVSQGETMPFISSTASFAQLPLTPLVSSVSSTPYVSYANPPSENFAKPAPPPKPPLAKGSEFNIQSFVNPPPPSPFSSAPPTPDSFSHPPTHRASSANETKK